MTHYEFDIAEPYVNEFFRPIRNKSQVIELLMKSIKYMLINPTVDRKINSGKLILYVNKMCRLFFVMPGKYFSISFPFHVLKDKEGIFTFSYRGEMDIDSEVTSEVISLLNDKSFNSGCSLEFVGRIYQYQENSYNDYYWEFLKELFFMEDGYLRYDYDKKSYQQHLLKGTPNIHPLNHYDIFYSNNSTFKIGLRKEILEDEFIDFVNIRTDCKFI
ncbi:hypothetical protein G3485_09620 [Shewanella baltica]|uniref:hypothetical protein n=2 Tax=Shewanella baltica TaxID=62322 RepID=UPI00217E0555|nr:hypothetical protein [Shewanella baltica]MCS6213632.1 hypothetical protein [Shewanella baltica]MCS6250390.1 hypothetical protein [Shewanella baltica]